MAETEVIVATDRWKTLKRVLPEDVYLAIKGFEKAVGEQIGGTESIGSSVQIWTVLCQFLREHEPALIEMAKEFASGDASDAT